MFKTTVRFTIFILAFQYGLANSDSLSASQSIDPQRMMYDIFSEKKKIGKITHRIVPTDRGYLIAEASQIKISGWWGKLDLRSITVESYDAAGRLLESDNKTRDGKSTHLLKTHLNNNGYLASYRIIKKTKQNEQFELELLDELIKQSAPINADALKKLSHSIFSDRTEKVTSKSFSASDFDTTSTYLPYYLQENAIQGIRYKITLYDPEELKMTDHQVEDLGWEEVTLSQGTIKSRHFTLTDDKNPPTHLWIGNFSALNTEEYPSNTNLKDSIPYLVRLTAEDKDGPIEIVVSMHSHKKIFE